MFKDNTVFVIGAGSSAEFGFPIGSGLTTAIKTNCDFVYDHGSFTKGPSRIVNHYDRTIGRTKHGEVHEYNKRLEASWRIRDGIESADSIDEYIYRYSDDPIIAEVGKLQIAYAISLAEEDSILGSKRGFDQSISGANDTWIWAFFKTLISGIKASEIEKIGSNITIICFNYDRCIEQYLEHAIARSFHDVSLAQAREIVRNIRIVHPYGKLGELDDLPFGASEKFARMAENLITWSETIREPEILDDIQRAITGAKRIVFLGFAFANQNMQLLNAKPTSKNYSGPRVYSTGYLLPRETEESLKLNINGLYSDGVAEGQLQNIHFQYGAKCKEFFDIHRLNLAR
ncbi:hypothetical protein J2X76_004764 [Neorhizobium sp. 2083]|uniref:hypothetical protein n=1 Tax=Neorhizobium sp. 2083 TaxID=2817762 RepID=UPI00285F2518|nr:hypothetical protein [Neorhizobium sp. 2083]MDR6819572.1 hypothetical protein [Neorhizobium sp. 2083]